MRADMFKVLVERPRRGKGWQSTAARWRGELDGPKQLGMRAGLGGVSLNENLAPLKRYLRAQVGRPWNKVFSEISACIDRRNTVQQHILQHVDQFIAVHVELREGRLVDLKYPGGWPHRDLISQRLYVDPRTGIIRVNKEYRSWSRQRKDRDRVHEAEIAKYRRWLDAKTALLRLDGAWFQVEMERFPRGTSGPEMRYDSVMKRKTSRDCAEDNKERERLYGAEGLYALRRRQLSRREMKELGLAS